MSTSAEPHRGVALREEPAPEAELDRLESGDCSALRDDRQRAECMAAIQNDAVQLALDLLVTHPDLRGFFRVFIKRLVDDSGAHACGVWLIDEPSNTCDLWMANIGGESLTADSAGWASLNLAAREHEPAPGRLRGVPRGRSWSTTATTRGCPRRCGRSIVPPA